MTTTRMTGRLTAADFADEAAGFLARSKARRGDGLRMDTATLSPRDELKALGEEARAIAEKAKGRSSGKEGDVGKFEPDEISRLGEIKTLADAARLQLKAAADASEVLRDLALAVDEDDVEKVGAKYFGQLGEAFAGSRAYKQWHEAGAPGAREGSQSPIEIKTGRIASMAEYFQAKATIDTITDANRIVPQRLPLVDQLVRPRLTLLDLITRGSMNSSSVEYLQITAIVRGAALVAEGALKPLSDLTTLLADAKAFTYADGFDITNQALADTGFVATWMQAELPYSLDRIIEGFVLNGTGTGQPRGILNTTGVKQVAFATDMVTTVRKGITAVTRDGGSVQGVALNPVDDEAWDLLKDGNNRYYGNGPFGTGPSTAWGYPRIVSELVPAGTAILGDFRTVALLDREGLSILAFNQHKDYAQRNMTYVRAELRAGQAIFRPGRLAVCDLAA